MFELLCESSNQQDKHQLTTVGMTVDYGVKAKITERGDKSQVGLSRLRENASFK